MQALINAMTNGIDGIRPVAPWGVFNDQVVAAGGYGGGRTGGQYGGGGSGGPWGPPDGGGSVGGRFDVYEWLLDYSYTTPALINAFVVGYRGYINERLSLSDYRL